MWAKYFFSSSLFFTLNVILCPAAGGNFYRAAVVEYNPSANSVKDYLDIISGIQEGVDLIVFPESTLLESATLVPDGVVNQTTPCNSSDYTEDYFKQISCAAAKRRSYIVVNVNEKAYCYVESQATGDKRPCSSTGFSLYNTDVVFNRSGAVVSRYRKYNLLGEFSKNTTLSPDISTFTTDYNVTYGLFTSFDILFETPALALTRGNIKNIIFPTMWFSELPFLTALQAQQMFAVAIDVNFLSSGANSPVRGSGGTGIFQGTNGPVVYDYVEAGGSKVYVAEVGNTPDVVPEGKTGNYYELDEEEIDVHAKAMDGFTLTRDQVDVYTSTPLNTSTPTTIETLCHNEFCCDFNVTITLNNSAITTENRYHYRLVAFSGVRSFSGGHNSGVEICGIIFCQNATHIESCATRFPEYSNVSWPITFESIEIKANFTETHTRQQYPNSLLSHIRPIFPNATSWSSVEHEEEGVVERIFTLNVAQKRLLTFAIYGRDFSRDNNPAANDDSMKMVRLFTAISVGIAFSVLRAQQ